MAMWSMTDTANRGAGHDRIETKVEQHMTDMTATLRECRSALLAAHLDALTAATNYPFNLGKTDP
jgi:uncharacterized membrane protein YgcG